MEREHSEVRRALAGDEEAFDRLFAALHPRVYRYALSRLRDPMLAEDVAQTTLVKVMSKLDRFHGRSPLFTWVCTFCRHEIGAVLRRRPEIGLDEARADVRNALEGRGATPSPMDVIEQGELAALVRSVLEGLPPHYRDALRQKYVHGRRVAEIGASLGVGEKAAESLLTRARVAFRRGVEARDDLVQGGLGAPVPREVAR